MKGKNILYIGIVLNLIIGLYSGYLRLFTYEHLTNAQFTKIIFTDHLGIVFGYVVVISMVIYGFKKL